MTSGASRGQLISLIEAELEERKLYWFGLRGHDAATLEDIKGFAGSYSVVGAYDRLPDIHSMALEDLSRIRVDLDAHDIDEEPSGGPVEGLRSEMLSRLRSQSAIVTYRPSAFVNNMALARHSTTRLLGMFKEHQYAFEHKPWVERAVGRMNIPSVPWRYYAPGDLPIAQRWLDEGPHVARRSRGSGGTGIARVDTPEQLTAVWPRDADLISLSPFIEDTLPINLSGVIWDNGITIHYLSVQIIGIPQLTSLQFGFCGSDFSAAQHLPRGAVDMSEAAATKIGEWMFRRGYRGAFGVDFLLIDNQPLFMEVNPRLQGSTHLSNRISRSMGEPDVILDHVAAHLGLSAEPPRERLYERMQRHSGGSYFVHHWPVDALGTPGAGDLMGPIRQLEGFSYADVTIARGQARDPGAPTFRAVFSDSITSDGFTLAPAVTTALDHVNQQIDGRTLS